MCVCCNTTWSTLTYKNWQQDSNKGGIVFPNFIMKSFKILKYKQVEWKKLRCFSEEELKLLQAKTAIWYLI